MWVKCGFSSAATSAFYIFKIRRFADPHFTPAERVQLLAGIAFALCCHSNATRALIANPPNNAQLGGIHYYSPKLHLGPCNSVGTRHAAADR